MPQYSTKVMYTNHKGVQRVRNIDLRGAKFIFGSNEWHTELQWLLLAYCNDKKAKRTFAVKDCDFTGGEE